MKKPSQRGRFGRVEAVLLGACLLLSGWMGERLQKRHAGSGPAEAAEAHLPLLEFALLDRVLPDENYHPVYPEALGELDGQRVRIQGFLAAFPGQRGQGELMLQPYPVHCSQCLGPPVNQVVLLRLAASPRSRPLEEGPVEAAGVLRLWRVDSPDPAHEDVMFLFVMDEAAVRPVTMNPTLLEAAHSRHLQGFR